MAIVVLNGDPGYPEAASTPVRLDNEPTDPVPNDQSGGPGAGADGDGSGEVLPGTYGVVRVRQRLFEGYDDAGNPTFSWQDVVMGLALFEVDRKEIDSYSVGVTAKVTVAYAGDTRVTEGAVVVDWLDQAWDVQSVVQTGESLEMKVRRVGAT